jgi:transcriptional repressor NrdR
MRCPFCQNEDTQVIDSRDSDEGESIRRRRECERCNKRFTTYERVELMMPALVKRDGRRDAFDETKLRGSMLLALRKRPYSSEALDQAIARINEKLRASAEREVRSEVVGELVMRELKKLDKVAYVRFASVYRSFEDMEDFAEAIDELRPARMRRGR